jgi:putative oxidoreductase
MKNHINSSISALLILLFSYTAVSKLLDFPTFSAQLRQTPYLNHFAIFLAIAIPLLELAIIVLLTRQATRKTGLIISLGLLSVFTLYIGAMLLTHQKMPCTCGGVISKMKWEQHIIFNLFFIAINVIALTPKRKSLNDSQTDRLTLSQ